MKLLRAIERLNKLDSDITKLDHWLSHLQFNEKPVTGKEWHKLKSAISAVIDDIAEERDVLEEKVLVVVKDLEIEDK